MENEFSELQFPARLSGPLAIAHVTVIPMDSERELPDHTIVVEYGVIRAMARSRDSNLDGMRVVDGTGRYAIPGLADMYTHYREPTEAPLYLANGITFVRTGGSPFQLAMERIAERAEFPSPRMFTVSPSIDGVGPAGRTDMPGGVPMTRPEQANELVTRFVQRGYRQIKAFSLLAPVNLSALGRAAAAAGVRLVGNCPNAMSWEEAIEAGMTCFEQLHLIARDHLRSGFQDQDYWDRFDPAPGTHLDFAAIRRLAHQLAEKQIWSIPTLVFHQRASRPVEESMADPSLKYVPRSTIEDWEATIVRWAGRGRVTVEQWREVARERAEAFHQVISIFHAAGAPLMTGTDSLNPYNVQGDSLHQELENVVSAGMRPYEALRCATAEPARFVGQSDVCGTLAVGKRADLVLVRANPLRDIGAIRHVEAALVNGYYLSRAELDGLLQQRAALVSRPPRLPATDLAESGGDGTVVDEGSWIERIVGADFGRLSYRHTRLSNGDWLIEERHAGANPRRHPERRTARLVLAPDLTLRSGEHEIESFVGKEVCRITRSDPGGYVAESTAVDGYKSRSTLSGERKIPSERMALTIVPLLIAGQGEQTAGTRLAALDVEAPNVGLADMTLSAAQGETHAAPAGEVEWSVQIDRPGQATQQTYRVGSDGRFLSMQEMLPLLWPRELLPISSQSAE